MLPTPTLFLVPRTNDSTLQLLRQFIHSNPNARRQNTTSSTTPLSPTAFCSCSRRIPSVLPSCRIQPFADHLLRRPQPHRREKIQFQNMRNDSTFTHREDYYGHSRTTTDIAGLLRTFVCGKKFKDACRCTTNAPPLLRVCLFIHSHLPSRIAGEKQNLSARKSINSNREKAEIPVQTPCANQNTVKCTFSCALPRRITCDRNESFRPHHHKFEIERGPYCIS